MRKGYIKVKGGRVDWNTKHARRVRFAQGCLWLSNAHSMELRNGDVYADADELARAIRDLGSRRQRERAQYRGRVA